jgi:curved DNA-binding protein CbpA
VTTPYNVLGVSTQSDDEAIRTAFRKAAKQYHPDLNPGDPSAERRFKRLIRARDVLLNSERRSAGQRFKKTIRGKELLPDSQHQNASSQRQARRRKKYTLATIGVSALVAFAAFNVVLTEQSISFDLRAMKLASTDPGETHSSQQRLTGMDSAEITPPARAPREGGESTCGNDALSGRAAHPCNQKRPVPASKLSPPKQLVRGAAKAFRRLALKLQSATRAGM